MHPAAAALSSKQGSEFDTGCGLRHHGHRHLAQPADSLHHSRVWKRNKSGRHHHANEETGLTSREGVYAGGDAVTGAATVILAMGAGKTAAKAMDDYIQNKNK